jgi:tetratricopeptide (TPR) repeat protein
MGMVWSMVAGFAGVVILATSGLAADAQTQAAGARKLAPLTWGSAPPEPSGKLTTEAARKLMAGKPEEALALAQQALAATPRSSWAQYQKASALAALRRWDEAVAAYDAALKSFGGSDDWGRSVALWGRSEALREAGRCDEAKTSFNEYVALVASRDKKAAEQANQQAGACASGNARREERTAAAPPVEPPGPAAEPATKSAAKTAVRSESKLSAEDEAAGEPAAGSAPAPGTAEPSVGKP